MKNVICLIYVFSAVGAATLQNKLYVCGGYDGISSLNTVECYDPEKNEWVIFLKCFVKIIFNSLWSVILWFLINVSGHF